MKVRLFLEKKMTGGGYGLFFQERGTYAYKSVIVDMPDDTFKGIGKWENDCEPAIIGYEKIKEENKGKK